MLLKEKSDTFHPAEEEEFTIAILIWSATLKKIFIEEEDYSMKYSRCNINGHNYYKVQISMPNGKRKILYGKSIAELREKEVAFREEMKTMPPLAVTPLRSTQHCNSN